MLEATLSKNLKIDLQTLPLAPTHQIQEPSSTKDKMLEARLQMRRSISSKSTVPNGCKEEIRNAWDIVGDCITYDINPAMVLELR